MKHYYAIVRSGTGTLGKPSARIEMQTEPQDPDDFDQCVVMGNDLNLVHLYIRGIRLTRQELQSIAVNIDRQGGEYRRRE